MRHSSPSENIPYAPPDDSHHGERQHRNPRIHNAVKPVASHSERSRKDSKGGVGQKQDEVGVITERGGQVKMEEGMDDTLRAAARAEVASQDIERATGEKGARLRVKAVIEKTNGGENSRRHSQVKDL